LNAISVFRKQRTNRFIIEHLLRNGYFETAQKLAEYVGADNTNKNVFHVAKQVEESLKRRDLSICLHWVVDNRSKLHRMQSYFETEVRIQQLIELIKEGKRLEAVNFLRTHFGSAEKWNANLLKVCLF
jgi:macrophage erythroblast attacher